MLKSMTMNKCPEFPAFADPSLLLKNKTNHQLPNLGHPRAVHCKAKNFKNRPSPLCFPFCFSSLPTDALGTTSPDFYVENWVHLAIAPSCPLPPWMWSWEPMFSHHAPLWQWGEGAPSPLGLSAVHTPPVQSWHTPPGRGGGGCRSPPHRQKARCSRPGPSPFPRSSVSGKQPEPLPHSLRMLVESSLEIWVHLLHSLDPLTFVLFPDFQAYIGPNFKWLWKFRHSGFCKWFNWMAGNAQVSQNT